MRRAQRPVALQLFRPNPWPARWRLFLDGPPWCRPFTVNRLCRRAMPRISIATYPFRRTRPLQHHARSSLGVPPEIVPGTGWVGRVWRCSPYL